MVYAQLKNGIIKNTIVLDDTTLLDLFQVNPLTNEPYDLVIRIDTLEQPGIGWSFDGLFFSPPPEPILEEEI